MPDLEDELDRLYGLPLEEFVSARTALANRLKKEGDAEGAAAVRALRKPTLSVWTVNKLARRSPDHVRRLLDAAAALREAQRQALAGEGAGALREAQRAERAAIRSLVQTAREVLAEAGRPPSPQTVERISETLRAAAVDDEARVLLERGRLEEDYEQAGFDPLASLAASLPPRGAVRGSKAAPRRRPPAATSSDELAERRRRREEERRRLQKLRARARELDRAAGAAERDADRAALEAERSRQAADDARTRAHELRAEAARAAAELADAERSAGPRPNRRLAR